MFKIAVCDDLKETVEEIDKFLQEYQEAKNQVINVARFYNAEALWEYLNHSQCDLIILDIELVKMNGIELGQLIRNKLNDHTVNIIYISAMDGYDRQLFDVQPLNFLPKPVDKNKLFDMLDLSVTLIRDTERFFVFENKQGTFRIKLSDILYFECFNHNIKIVTTSKDYVFKSTLSNVLKQLSDSRFLQIFRSVIINYNQASRIEYDKITMINGEKIFISREKRKEVRKIISEWEEIGT